MTEHSEHLWILLKQIPRGKVTTYKILAEKLGIHPRAVGKLLHLNPHPIVVPCHRVVCSDGKLGGYKLGVKKKISLLGSECIMIKNGKVDLQKVIFRF